MKTLICIQIFLVIQLTTATAANISAGRCRAALAKEEQWQRFRETFPYHIQTLAVYDQTAIDNSALILLSEPPPHIDTAVVKSGLSSYLTSVEIRQHRVGYDGWTKDLLLVVEGVHKHELLQLLTDLYEYAFFTTYKADFLDLPLPATLETKIAENVDLQILPADLRNWLFDANGETFFGLAGQSPSKSLKQLFSNHQSGLFLSTKPGLVLWLLRKGEDLTWRREDIRKFAMETDLVLGAVSNGEQIAILARRRRIPLTALPPLRTEAILTIAADTIGILQQSFERNAIFAGRYDEKHDWAPIYLSPNLRNTEFGSLLNITDQMLKSWSLNGSIEYENFFYTKPKHYFCKDLLQELDTEELTFNWNTKKGGYITVEREYELMSFTRTAAVSISYIAEETDTTKVRKQIARYENLAHAFFAGLNDVNLVRVANYSALLQIFFNFDIKATSLTPPQNAVTQGNELLKNTADRIYRHLVSCSDHEFDNLIRQAFNYTFKTDLRVEKATLKRQLIDTIRIENPGWSQSKIDSFLHSIEPELDSMLRLDSLRIWDKLEALYPNLWSETVTSFQQLRTDLQRLMKQYGPGAPSDFAGRMIEYREAPPGRRPEEITLLAKSYREDITFCKAWTLLLPCLLEQIKLGSLDQLRQAYTWKEGVDPEGWIKTPSIVISWSTDINGGTGGHSLQAAVAVVVLVDPNLSDGKVEVRESYGRKVIFVSESDLDKVTPEMTSGAADYIKDSSKLKIFMREKLRHASAPNLQPRNTIISEEASPLQRGAPTSGRLGSTVSRALTVTKSSDKNSYSATTIEASATDQAIKDIKKWIIERRSEGGHSFRLQFVNWSTAEEVEMLKAVQDGFLGRGIAINRY